jgi:hypothetical protein
MKEVGHYPGWVFGFKLGCNVVMGLSLSLRLNGPFNRRDGNDRALMNDCHCEDMFESALNDWTKRWNMGNSRDLEVYAVVRSSLGNSSAVPFTSFVARGVCFSR